MNSIYRTVVDTLHASLQGALLRLGAFLPNVLSFLVILFMGWVAAWLVSRLLQQLFKTLRLDSFAERNGLASTLSDVGLGIKPSALISGLAYWLILIFAVLPAVEALHLNYFTLAVAKLLSYIPTLIAAALILLVGLSVSRLLSAALVRTARNANLEYSNALGILSRYFLSLIVIVITLAQLGVQTAILTVILAVILLSLGLASALALGFGSRAVIANLLAGAFVREHFPEGREIEVQGVRGRVVAIHSVGAVIAREDGIVTIPNTILMENVVE